MNKRKSYHTNNEPKRRNANIVDLEQGPRSLPVRDAACYLGVSESWIRKLILNKRIETVRLGRRVMIPVVTLRHISEHGCEGIR